MAVAPSRGSQYIDATVSDRTTDGVFVVDRDWKYVSVNPAGAAGMHAPADELVGHDIWATSPDAVGSDFEHACRRAMHDGEPAVLEQQRRTDDEWYAIRIFPSAEGLTIYCRDITEQRRSERSVRRLAAIVESSDDAVISQDLDGNVLTWNAAAQAMFGYRADEIVGRSIVGLSEPGLRDERRALMATVHSGERVEHALTRRVCKDGSVVDVSVSMFPVRGVDGSIVGSASIVRDVSAQLQAEGRLRAVLDAMAEGVAETTLDGHIVTVNQAFATIAGFASPEEVIANITDMSAIYARPGQRAEILAQAAAAPGFSRADVELKTPDGRRVWVRAKFRQRFDDAGVMTGMHVVAEDVTATRAAEAAMRESEELLHFAFHDNPIPLIVVELTPGERVITEANAALEAMMGYGPGELAGRDLDSFIHDDDLEAERALASSPGASEGERVVFESRRRHRDGHWVPVAVTSITFQSAEGRAHAIAAVEDITERRNLEAQSRAARDLLEARAESEQALADLARLTLEGSDFDELGRTACGLVARILDVDFATIWLPVDGGPTFAIAAAWGWDRRLLATIETIAGADSQAADAARRGVAVIVDDWSTETRFVRSPLLEAHHVRSGLTVAIRHDQRSVGVVSVQTCQQRSFDDAAVRFLESVAQLVGIALEQDIVRNRLSQSERTLQAIVDNAPLAIHVLDPAGRFLLVNRELERIVGLPRDLLIGKTRLEVPALVDGAPLAGLVDGIGALQRRAPLTTEQTVARADGAHSYLTVDFPLLGPDARAYGIGGISTEVTELVRSRAETRSAWLESMERLALAVELRDDSTGAHIERMAAYSELLGHLLGLSDDRCAQIRAVAPLHDLGKIATPDRVLLKRGPLTPKERTIMTRHAEVGFRLLTGSGSETLELAATIAHTHHERFDGSGYPRGLAGNDIPIEGRIVAVADCFDALTGNRAYRLAMSVDEAVQVMRDDIGHFDPEVLRVFLDRLDEVERIWAAYNPRPNVSPRP